jgi:hypothetical protein
MTGAVAPSLTGLIGANGGRLIGGRGRSDTGSLASKELFRRQLRPSLAFAYPVHGDGNGSNSLTLGAVSHCAYRL